MTLAGAAALLGLVAALPAAAQKKDRAAPREVSPVVLEGRRYEAPHWGKSRGLPQNGGYVAAIDPASGRELWLTRIYRVGYERGREGDKQDVFITGLEAEPGGRGLLISDERGRRYRLDLRTRKVERG